jgi:CheY-like chemotaxis protein
MDQKWASIAAPLLLMMRDGSFIAVSAARGDEELRGPAGGGAGREAKDMVTPGRRSGRAHEHPQPERIRVLVVESYRLVRQALVQILTQECAFRIVAETGDAESAVEALTRHRPEVVLVAADLPPAGGAGATRLLLEQAPHVRVLALGTQADRADENEMRLAGAVGYISKTATAEDLCEAVRAAYHWG